MQAAVLTGPGSLEIVEYPEEPDPGPGEVLVAVRRVGICGTDYHAYGGNQNFVTYPCLLGHELAVEVLETGPGVTHVAPGDTCAVLPYLSCGTCVACARGRTNCCERIQVFGVTRPGGLRERMLLPAGQLFPGDGLSLEQLALVESLGIGWHAVTRARPRPEETALVLGAGPIGLAVAQAVRATGARVVLADVLPDRVAFARGSGLAAVTANGDLGTRLREQDSGALPSLVFDASGNRGSMEAAFDLVGAGGRLVFVGHTRGPVTFANPGFHARELDLHASRNATADDWRQVIDAVRAGSLDAVGWINHRTTLSAVAAELPRLATAPAGVVKALVEIDGPGGAR